MTRKVIRPVSDATLHKRLVAAKESHEIAMMALYCPDLAVLDRYWAARKELFDAETPILERVSHRVRASFLELERRKRERAA